MKIRNSIKNEHLEQKHNLSFSIHILVQLLRIWPDPKTIHNHIICSLPHYLISISFLLSNYHVFFFVNRSERKKNSLFLSWQKVSHIFVVSLSLYLYLNDNDLSKVIISKIVVLRCFRIACLFSFVVIIHVIQKSQILKAMIVVVDVVIVIVCVSATYQLSHSCKTLS